MSTTTAFAQPIARSSAVPLAVMPALPTTAAWSGPPIVATGALPLVQARTSKTSATITAVAAPAPPRARPRRDPRDIVTVAKNARATLLGVAAARSNLRHGLHVG